MQSLMTLSFDVSVLKKSKKKGHLSLFVCNVVNTFPLCLSHFLNQYMYKERATARKMFSFVKIKCCD